MEALRVLTVEKSASAEFCPFSSNLYLSLIFLDAVRTYHKSYYLPHNLVLVVTGPIDPSSLLEVLNRDVEPSFLSHGQANGPRPNGWKRPFLKTASKGGAQLNSVIKEVVEFPEKDESVGEVTITWVGPESNVSVAQKADLSGIKTATRPKAGVLLCIRNSCSTRRSASWSCT